MTVDLMQSKPAGPKLDCALQLSLRDLVDDSLLPRFAGSKLVRFVSPVIRRDFVEGLWLPRCRHMESRIGSAAVGQTRVAGAQTCLRHCSSGTAAVPELIYRYFGRQNVRRRRKPVPGEVRQSKR